jgi:hypothetical protein
MNERVGRDVVSFAERYFDIYGEFEGMVYHRKRNGELEKYPYEPVSYYHRTALAIRNEWIRTYAARVSNPRLPEYREIIRKLNYYTPYIMSAGSCKLRGETVFYVRKRGDYEFRWQGSPLGFRQKVGKSTEVELSFGAEGEFVLECWFEDELYCERRFIITGDDIDVAYDEWLAANLEELLTEPEPEYESVKTYRRGLRSNPNWLKSIEGKYHEDVLYQVPEYAYKDQKGENPWLYHRRRYDHRENPQTQEFNHKIKEIGGMWQSLSQTERELWNRKAAEYSNKRWTGFNLFTSEKLRE